MQIKLNKITIKEHTTSAKEWIPSLINACDLPNIPPKNLITVKKKLINAQELNNYLKSNPKCSRRIGSLPFDFFSQISNQNKSIVKNAIQK